eukprot:6172706-Pleurochrysis_carterae.AAC.3
MSSVVRPPSLRMPVDERCMKRSDGDDAADEVVLRRCTRTDGMWQRACKAEAQCRCTRRLALAISSLSHAQTP